MNFTVEKRDAYESRMKWLMIEANTLKKAKEDGHKEGLEEGLEQVALKMLSENMEPNFIASVTGLSIEVLKNLKEK